MGRIVQGNAVSVQATKLTTTMGILLTSPVIADNNNTASLTSGPWGSFQTTSSTNSACRPNTASEQVNNSFTIQQDPIKPYNLVQANISGAGLRQIILDDELNMVANYSPSMGGSASMAAVRLYDGVMYRFGFTGTIVRVEAVNLATGVTTPYTTTLSFSVSNMRVFNWQIGGKFHMVLTAATAASFISFDLTTGAFVVIKSWTGTGLNTLYAMHVSPDGAACSVSAYNTNGNYAVLCFPASGSASFSDYSNTGHMTANGQWIVFGQNGSGATVAITEACAVEVSGNAGNTGSSTYLMSVYHMAGGDTAVRATQFTGTVTNVYPVTLSATCASRPNNTLVFGAVNGSSSAIQVGRSGANLTLTATVGSSGFTNQHLTVPCTLPGLHVSMNAAGGEGSAYLSFVSALSNTGRLASWSYSGTLGSRNANPYATASDSCRMAFVTRTGRMFYLGWYWSQGQTTATYNTARLPVFIASRAATYDVQVIGGGGQSGNGASPGGSSSFAGITAAPGGVRSGSRAGSTVLTSGSPVGTGGRGYGEELFGQGEDTTAAGSYGGGSGYLATGRVSVQAGEVVPYVAGIAPQYGGQGAVLLTEVL